MNAPIDPVLGTIAACEGGFWALLALGLCLRYLLRRRRMSVLVLGAVPLLDVALLVAVGVDLARGGEVGFAHRLAPIYLGCTVMFAGPIIRWADARFAYRFGGGPIPAKVPPRGPERRRKEWVDFARWLGAAAIATALTLALGYTVADAPQRSGLFGVFGSLGVVTAIWLLTGPVWYSGRS
ncbi:hypothetical protein P0W64_00430 [Tsukamurella sp. 8F]|uniref:hypothetical protein n=1 Tax=unclassified Tsukamurella TaxID=2633480 RepID=UPI0023B9CD6E|nr:MULTISPECIES: hypothetical protein [unclassified Tsukamurella]MDF0531290.1 hypothetical protein [Tsukamurella sp. 8J]MDF0585239.1 hypothetical protein [Tsukamurella sp. 8F]